MKMLKVRNGYVSFDKITGISVKENQGIVTTVGGDKYCLSEGYTPIDSNAYTSAIQEHIRAYIVRYVMENTVDLDEDIEKAMAIDRSDNPPDYDVIGKASEKHCGKSCGYSSGCGFSHGTSSEAPHGFMQYVMENAVDSAVFSQGQSSVLSSRHRELDEAIKKARARHEQYKKESEQARKQFDERMSRNREQMDEFADVVDAIEKAFDDVNVHMRRF